MEPAVSGWAGRRAERAWVTGVRCLGQGNTSAAAEYFGKAVEHDPGAADAWLGLHALGLRQREAVQAMGQNTAVFGALRRKNSLPLKSRFEIGSYVDFRLETHRDLWLAVHAALLDEGELESAWAGLRGGFLDSAETHFILTRYACLASEWKQVLSFASGVTGDAFLHDEAQLYVARALMEQDVLQEALRVLQRLPQKLEAEGLFAAEVAYWRGKVCERLGQREDALAHFQHSFRLAPGLYDVARRAQDAADAPEAVPGAASLTGAAAGPGAGGADPSVDPAVSLREAQGQLEAMIGLEPVKRQVRTLVAQLQMAQYRREQGITVSSGIQHLVFVGPPGTGKTTVARIMGKIFAGLGLLTRGHVVEAQRADLVGKYLGHTAQQTSAKIDEALGGVLFIDEAYALHHEGHTDGDAFGDEALEVLLKRAEDDRHRLVIVLAGYEEEMDRLLAVNPGLSSRFTTRIGFPSYSADELYRIALHFIDGHGDALSDEAGDALRNMLGEAEAAGRTAELGNGRFVRNLCQKAAAARDLRLSEAITGEEPPSRQELMTCTRDDIAVAFGELTGAVGREPQMNG